MPERMTAIERAFAAQDALLAGLRASEAYAEVHVGLGPPVEQRPEAAWVSCSFKDELSPEASDLSQFSGDVELGIGIAVTQYVGIDEDWTALRARTAQLVKAAERLIIADPLLSGTCSLAYVREVTAREGRVDDKQMRLSAALIVQAQQYLR